jgi:hypothetical protein
MSLEVYCFKTKRLYSASSQEVSNKKPKNCLFLNDANFKKKSFPIEKNTSRMNSPISIYTPPTKDSRGPSTKNETAKTKSGDGKPKQRSQSKTFDPTFVTNIFVKKTYSSKNFKNADNDIRINKFMLKDFSPQINNSPSFNKTHKNFQYLSNGDKNFKDFKICKNYLEKSQKIKDQSFLEKISLPVDERYYNTNKTANNFNKNKGLFTSSDIIKLRVFSSKNIQNEEEEKKINIRTDAPYSSKIENLKLKKKSIDLNDPLNNHILRMIRICNNFYKLRSLGCQGKKEKIIGGKEKVDDLIAKTLVNKLKKYDIIGNSKKAKNTKNYFDEKNNNSFEKFLNSNRQTRFKGEDIKFSEFFIEDDSEYKI